MSINENIGDVPSITVTYTGYHAKWLSHVDNHQTFAEFLVTDYCVPFMFDKKKSIGILKNAGFTEISILAVCASVGGHKIDLSRNLSPQFVQHMSDPEHGERMSEKLGVPPCLWAHLIELLSSDDIYCETTTPQTSWFHGSVGEVLALALMRLFRDYRLTYRDHSLTCVDYTCPDCQKEMRQMKGSKAARKAARSSKTRKKSGSSKVRK